MDKRRLQFFVYMHPPTKTFQDKIVRTTKSGKAVIHNSSDLQEVIADFRDRLIPHVPSEMLNGPIRIVIKWIYEDASRKGEWKTTKPDVGNMSKSLLDVMTKLRFWKDDAHVSSLIEEKFWGDIPGLFIYLEEL